MNSHTLKRHYKLPMYYTPNTLGIFGPVDDFGFIHDLGDDSFDSMLYFFFGL